MKIYISHFHAHRLFTLYPRLWEDGKAKGDVRKKVLSSKLTSQLNPTMQCGGSQAAGAVGFIDRQTLG